MFPGDILRQRYKIIKQVGSGQFGDTYLVQDLNIPNKRKCVVKHLSPKNPAPRAVAIAISKFIEEAESLSSLGEQAQIPHLYDYFEENGEFYLVQEFIEGHNLALELNSGKRWSEAETVQFLQELLGILEIVHQENKIHQDIKPSNIMRRDRDSKLFLIDFGAVKEAVNVDEKGESSIVIGTPVYMAPEHSLGNSGFYSDVYAIGIMGIQAITGLTAIKVPRDTDSLKRTLNDLKIKINPKLESVLGKMIESQSEKRYQNAAEALQALPKTKDDFLKKLLFTLGGAIALIISGIYAWQFIDRPNYAQLETSLQNGDWIEADKQTDRILLKIAKKDNALDAKSITNFPCQSLSKIDQLWTDNSNGRFGFSPQKQAYLETGNQIGQYTESTYQAFGNLVGWRTFGYWSLYGDLKFTDIAPVGHLPSPGRVSADKPDLRVRERGMLLSRFGECGLRSTSTPP